MTDIVGVIREPGSIVGQATSPAEVTGTISAPAEITGVISAPAEITGVISAPAEITAEIIQKGEVGLGGIGLEFVWDGTRLGIRQTNSVEYTYRELRIDGADSFFAHEQIIASKDWTIEHSMNKHPSVTVLDSAGTVVIGEIEYINANGLILHFNAEFSGRAYLN